MTQTKEQKIKEAVRMVGHLLETNSTSYWFAKNKQGIDVDYNSPDACRWCLVGAMTITAEKLGLELYCLERVVAKTFGVKKVKVRGFYPLASEWDGSSKEAQQNMVRKLKGIQ